MAEHTARDGGTPGDFGRTLILLSTRVLGENAAPFAGD